MELLKNMIKLARSLMEKTPVGKQVKTKDWSAGSPSSDKSNKPQKKSDTVGVRCDDTKGCNNI